MLIAMLIFSFRRDAAADFADAIFAASHADASLIFLRAAR